MNNKQSFSIGQVVYILSSQGQNIIPAMVIEEQTIQTLQGTNVSWKIAIGEPGEKQKIVDSTKLSGEIFTSLDEIKNLLTKRLNVFIEQTIKVAKQRENVWYGKLRNESKILTSTQQTQKQNKIDPESFLEDLEGYTNKQSSPFTKDFGQISEEEKQSNLKEKLKTAIIPTREELENELEELKDDKVILTGPDGRPIIANIKI